MRRKIGIICMILGAALVLGALSIFLYNQHEASEAEKSVSDILPQLQDEIGLDKTLPTDDEEMNYSGDMPTIEIDGYEYIGYLSIPSLGLELPVMSDWSYPQLRIAPCRYSGSIWSDDMVLMAHNYARHFGQLSRLSIGEEVTFKDVNGITITYEVMAIDTLNPTEVEDMTSGEYDLTLFTCTYGGKSRVTVRCDRLEKGL
ncbi:sortase [Blautia obeum]|uniref:sortase n=1 Tax=Blautia obeum TaxID=40520 RepID=UPI003CFFD8AE